MGRLFRILWAIGVGMTISGPARAAEPAVPSGAVGHNPSCPTPAKPSCPPSPPPATPAQPPAIQPSPAVEPGPLAETDLAPERALALGGETFAAAPNMIGDFSGRFVTTQVTQPTVVRLSAPQFPTVVFFAPASFRAQVKIPFASSGAFKIADNESPRPQDRLFLTYNYYNDLFTGVQPAGMAPPGTAPTVGALVNFGIPTATGPLGPNATLIGGIFIRPKQPRLINTSHRQDAPPHGRRRQDNEQAVDQPAQGDRWGGGIHAF